MKTILNASMVILVMLFISGCANTPSNTSAANAKPDWIDNPGNGVSASAGFNAVSRVAQEELAISRARTEYANRFGVSVESIQITHTEVVNDHAHTESTHDTKIVTDQKDVKARVKQKWRDPVNDYLWVWLVQSDQ